MSTAFLVAPDALKGTLSASAAAAAIGRGLEAAGVPRPSIDLCPLSDGGEGFREVLTGGAGGFDSFIHRVPGPLGDSIEATWSGNPSRGQAVLDAAEIVGFSRCPTDRRDPRVATTYGVGALLEWIRRHASSWSSPLREITVGLGGSLTVDGGAGALHGLGCRLEGVPGPPAGGTLALLTRIEGLESVRRRWDGIEVRLAADVVNPLLGPKGAARIFGPQKGADPAAVDHLERSMVHWAEVLVESGAVSTTLPMSGAGGGLGFGLSVLDGARFESGFSVVAEAVDLDRRLAAADVVVTAEGALDAQSFGGKVTGEVIARARRGGKRIVVIPGRSMLDERDARLMGVQVVELAAIDSMGRALSRPAECLESAARIAVSR
ncbi:MAG: glycerate kinase [Phycisphaera sp.]|nr:glycerate kinase [Phycisphaera sp.]